MGRLTQYFLKGLLILVPMVATIYVFFLIFKKVDGIFHIPIPGVGFLLTLVFVTLVGFVASNVLMRGAVGILDQMFTRLPVTKMVYTSIKDLTGAFVGDKKAFDKPVAVELVPGSGVRVLGFVTDNNLGRLGLEGSVAVYLPQSYNFAGNLLVVPTDRITLLAAESSELMAYIVSGGISAKAQRASGGSDVRH